MDRVISRSWFMENIGAIEVKNMGILMYPRNIKMTSVRSEYIDKAMMIGDHIGEREAVYVNEQSVVMINRKSGDTCVRFLEGATISIVGVFSDCVSLEFDDSVIECVMSMELFQYRCIDYLGLRNMKIGNSVDIFMNFASCRITKCDLSGTELDNKYDGRTVSECNRPGCIGELILNDVKISREDIKRMFQCVKAETVETNLDYISEEWERNGRPTGIAYLDRKNIEIIRKYARAGVYIDTYDTINKIKEMNPEDVLISVRKHLGFDEVDLLMKDTAEVVYSAIVIVSTLSSVECKDALRSLVYSGYLHSENVDKQIMED